MSSVYYLEKQKQLYIKKKLLQFPWWDILRIISRLNRNCISEREENEWSFSSLRDSTLAHTQDKLYTQAVIWYSGEPEAPLKFPSLL